MSLRQMFAGSIVKPGFNPLVAQTPSYTYYLNSWGSNAYGQLGLGNRTNYSSPNQVGSLTNWIALTAGSYHSSGVKTDGTLWTWGYNVYGQLGLGNRTNYSSPKQVGSLTSWLSVASGNYSTYAIKTDGTLWAWGNSQFGQLGLGNTTNYSSPKQVGSLTNWSFFAECGDYSSIALKTDGTLWSWGQNNQGQLGLGNTTYYSSPKQIGALTNWSKICRGGNFTLAVKTDGTLWAWGYNAYGALGQSNTTNYSSPKQIGALTTWTTPGGSAYSSYAITNSGAFYSWGNGTNGELGSGANVSRSSPVQVGALTNWSKLPSSSNVNMMAIKTDGTLWGWGQNSSGQLGFNNVTRYSSPVQVGSLTTWNLVVMGDNFTIGLLY